jgi:hypothetical protein
VVIYLYISAHRVIQGGSQGINAFLYLHGGDKWFYPEEDPGTLERSLTTVEPGDNKVLSFLDIVLPDSASQIPALTNSPNPAAVYDARKWVLCGIGAHRMYFHGCLWDDLEALALHGNCKAILDSYLAWKLTHNKYPV